MTQLITSAPATNPARQLFSLVHFLGRLAARRQSDVVLALLVLGIVSIMLVPLPPFALDMMLSLNLITSVTLLLISIYIPAPTRFASFPSLLLLTTMMRLALNIASTRLILLKGEAGQLIHAIGTIVLGGDLVVGLVVFLILTLIQFLVVVKGAERVAEVAARFSLDAMPGKQMTIDADLRAGACTQEEAARRRAELATECQLHGAMDGAMKFVKGDTTAGLIITAINLVAGFVIGVARNGMSASDAARVYSVLTVGDGLVAQIPSMLITLCAGMITTRVGGQAEEREAGLGHVLRGQIFAYPKPLAIAGGFFLFLGCMPSVPTLPFLLLGGAAVATSRLARRQEAEVGDLRRIGAAIEGGDMERLSEVFGKELMVAKAQRADVDQMLPMVTPILLDLAPDLGEELGRPSSRLVSELLPAVRDSLFYDLGIRCMNVRVRANPHLRAPGTYLVYINEVPMATGCVRRDRVLVDAPKVHLESLGVAGEEALNPMTGAPNTWVDAAYAPALREAGIRCLDHDEFLATEIQACLFRNASRFLGMHEVQTMLDQLEECFPAMVREVVPRVVSVSRLTDLLKRLVDEGLSIRDLKTILESLATWGSTIADNAELVECVRADLREAISFKYGGLRKTINAYLLAPIIEDAIRDGLRMVDGAPQLLLEPELADSIRAAIRRQVRTTPGHVAGPIFLTDPGIRRFVRQLVRAELPGVVVLSHNDLNQELMVEPLGRVTVD